MLVQGIRGRILSTCGKITKKTYQATTANFTRLLDQRNSRSLRMTSNADLQRVKARAEETDKILADLQAQIAVIRQVAVRQAGQGEEEKLIKENAELKKEIEALKSALAVAEISHGVRQVAVPTKGSVNAVVSRLMNGAPEPTPAQASKKAEKVNKGPPQKTKGSEEPPKNAKKAKPAPKENKEAAEGGEPKPKKAGGQKGGGDAAAPMDISRLDLRVGKIIAVEKHPDADGLYVEQVDLGEAAPRTICSGLVNDVPLSAMRERVAVFMCNLKPVKMRGIFSQGMIMCASNGEKTEILVPPTDSAIGDRIKVVEFPGTPDAQLNPKKKIWETLKPDVRTNGDRVATYKGAALLVADKGPLMAPTLADAQIS